MEKEMNSTLRMTYKWADRNAIGESIPVVRYSQDWSGIEEICSPDDAVSLTKLSEASKPYHGSTLLTECALSRLQVVKIVAGMIGLFAGSLLVLWGVITGLQWIGLHWGGR
jgi:hypothetical protein